MKLNSHKRLNACRAIQDRLYTAFRERRISGGEMESAMMTLIPQLTEAYDARDYQLEAV